ncbi:tail fiber assembly protein [Yersinia enterocolitica]
MKIVLGFIGSNQMWCPLEIPEILSAGWVVIKNGLERPAGDYYASENGQWLPGPSPIVIEQMKANAIEKQKSLMTQASNMIGALSDEIEAMEDSGNDVPEKLHSDLKDWKQYRVDLKNVDTSTVLGVVYPVMPDVA